LVLPPYVISSSLAFDLCLTPNIKFFTYEAWGIPDAGFDPSYTFVRSYFVPPLILASVRAILSLYSFTTIITCYTWLVHKTATIKLKDVNIESYPIQQGDAAIGQSFSFFTYLTFWSLGFYFLVSSIHAFKYVHVLSILGHHRLLRYDELWMTGWTIRTIHQHLRPRPQ
jgi:hypothetical protein